MDRRPTDGRLGRRWLAGTTRCGWGRTTRRLAGGAAPFRRRKGGEVFVDRGFSEGFDETCGGAFRGEFVPCYTCKACFFEPFS
jgi:hypothetical protein